MGLLKPINGLMRHVLIQVVCTTPMKILFIGEIGLGQTSLMRMRALERLGHHVRGVHTIEPWMRTWWLKRQLQRRLQRGSIVDEINRRVLEAAREFRPNLVWAEKQEFLRVKPSTGCERWAQGWFTSRRTRILPLSGNARGSWM